MLNKKIFRKAMAVLLVFAMFASMPFTAFANTNEISGEAQVTILPTQQLAIYAIDSAGNRTSVSLASAHPGASNSVVFRVYDGNTNISRDVDRDDITLSIHAQDGSVISNPSISAPGWFGTPDGVLARETRNTDAYIAFVHPDTDDPWYPPMWVENLDAIHFILGVNSDATITHAFDVYLRITIGDAYAQQRVRIAPERHLFPFAATVEVDPDDVDIYQGDYEDFTAVVSNNINGEPIPAQYLFQNVIWSLRDSAGTVISDPSTVGVTISYSGTNRINARLTASDDADLGDFTLRATVLNWLHGEFYTSNP